MTKSVSCVVVSDNHGDAEALLELLSFYAEKGHDFLHCGDSESTSLSPIWTQMQTVKGNMDRDPTFLDRRIVSLGGKKILLTHGHLQGVKQTLAVLQKEANEAKVDIVCFGHTHIPYCHMHEGILYLNSGSISRPKGPTRQKTYAVLTVTEDALDVQYYTDTHQPIELVE